MQISQLGEHFTVAQYQPDKSGRATVRLVNGQVAIRIPYNFHSEDGTVSATKNVDAIVTPQQLTDIEAILVDVLQATNAEIESVQGWIKYVETA